MSVPTRQNEPNTIRHRARVWLLRNPVWAGFAVSMLIASIALVLVLDEQGDLATVQKKQRTEQREVRRLTAELRVLTTQIQTQRRETSLVVCEEINELRRAVRAVSIRFDIQPPLAGFEKLNCLELSQGTTTGEGPTTPQIQGEGKRR